MAHRPSGRPGARHRRTVSVSLIAFALGSSSALAESWPPDPVEAGFSAGDLLFKGADSGPGARLAARWSSGDRRWGHVGVLIGDAQTGWQVVHADTGEAEAARRGEPGLVRAETLAEFLADVNELGHFQVAFSGSARAAYLAAVQASVGVMFDRAYSLDTADALYCSELIWRAMSAGAGEDILPEKSRRIGLVYVSLSDISEHPLVREHAVFRRGSSPSPRE